MFFRAPTAKLIVGSIFFGLSGLFSVAYAQVTVDGMEVSIGETKLVPTLRVDYLVNDNAYLTRSNKVESSGVKLSPVLSWVADKGTTTLSATYNGSFAKFDESPLDYTDHKLFLNASAEANKRLRFQGSVSFAQEHEDLGSNLTAGSGSDYDEQLVYNRIGANAYMIYGAQGARGNLRLGLSTTDYSPKNLLEISEQTEYFSLTPYVEFSLRISPDARFLTQVRFSDIDYKIGTRDRKRVTLLAGLDFAPTGKLSGAVRVGASRSQFSDSDRDDVTSANLDVRLNYELLSYSRLILTAARRFDETVADTLASGEPTRDTLELDWRHEWSSRFYQIVSFDYNAYNRNCPTNSYDTRSIGAEFNYVAKRWLEFGIGIVRDDRSSQFCNSADEVENEVDYDRQKYGVHVRATL